MRFTSAVNNKGTHYIAIFDMDLCIGKLYHDEVTNNVILDTHGCDPMMFDAVSGLQQIMSKVAELQGR